MISFRLDPTCKSSARCLSVSAGVQITEYEEKAYGYSDRLEKVCSDKEGEVEVGQLLAFEGRGVMSVRLQPNT